MATYKRPGTYVEETLLPQAVEVAGTASAVGAFLGTCTFGPTTATLVTSWSEFVRLFGSFDANNPLTFAVYQYFANGGRDAYVARLAGDGATKANVTLTDRAGTPLSTLKVEAINPGAWANSTNTATGLEVEVVDNGQSDRFDLIVYRGGSGTPTGLNIVERHIDLSMDVNDARYVERVVNSNSTYVTVTNLNSATAAPANRPAAGGVKTLSTGADGTAPASTAYTAALDYGTTTAVFDDVAQSLVLNVPDVINMVDSDAIDVLQAAANYAAERGDVFVVADVPKTALTASDAITFVGSVASGITSTSYIAAYWPYVNVADPLGSAGTVRTVAPGGAIAGLYMANDAVNGVSKAPAGIGTSINTALSPSVRLTNTALDSLNSAAVPVNAIRSVPGAGVCVMGARTLGSAYLDRYVNVRRSLIYIKKSLTDLTQFAIFENNDERLWEQLRTVGTAFLNEFWQSGGLRGLQAGQAFYVICDETINTDTVISNGEVRMEVGVALQTPAEFVVIKIGQFQGGASVTSEE